MPIPRHGTARTLPYRPTQLLPCPLRGPRRASKPQMLLLSADGPIRGYHRAPRELPEPAQHTAKLPTATCSSQPRFCGSFKKETVNPTDHRLGTTAPAQAWPYPAEVFFFESSDLQSLMLEWGLGETKANCQENGVSLTPPQLVSSTRNQLENSRIAGARG